MTQDPGEVPEHFDDDISVSLRLESLRGFLAAFAELVDEAERSTDATFRSEVADLWRYIPLLTKDGASLQEAMIRTRDLFRPGLGRE
jgi:hypothetical protein